MSITYRVPGAILTERVHSVPLDHAQPDGAKITIFTRELAAPDGLKRPYLLFFQGGPGFEATRPTAPPSGWQKRAIADYRVLLIDQRGTGRSTPVGDIPGATPQEQAEYMTHLRADGIVRDAEWIRQELGIERWSILGQVMSDRTEEGDMAISEKGVLKRIRSLFYFCWQRLKGTCEFFASFAARPRIYWRPCPRSVILPFKEEVFTGRSARRLFSTATSLNRPAHCRGREVQ